jgi:hypothetical protein
LVINPSKYTRGPRCTFTSKETMDYIKNITEIENITKKLQEARRALKYFKGSASSSPLFFAEEFVV